MTLRPVEGATGVVLLGHGSPDPDWRRPLDALVGLLRTRHPGLAIELAFLDHGVDLEAAVDALRAAGCRRVQVLAALLSPGGKHVKRDMPRLIAEVGARRPEMTLVWQPDALGSDARVLAAMAEVVFEQVRAAGEP